ncbi:cryptochrome/photolyase family protein [Curtobacterium ammoniigenes]|uniref:cryptochrome/photolyase family protein n=1 Tax=Curtobacterium ammoniigenes TaxID=395387 RepID=UPI000AEBAD93
MSGSIVWLREDLRLGDNPALRAAIELDRPVTVVWILDDVSPGVRPAGAASRWWLHESLTRLADELDSRDSRLILRRGPAAPIIGELVEETDAEAVFWNRRYGQAERGIDAEIKTRLRDEGRTVRSFAANLLWEPWTLRTGQGDPFKVFTPFWNAARNATPPREPLPKPRAIPRPPHGIASDDLDSWELNPTRPDWASTMRTVWEPGELGAHRRFHRFLDNGLDDYDHRDEPARSATSAISPHLRWGEISPFQIWHLVQEARHASAAHRASFLRQLTWREFNWHEYFHVDDLATRNVRAEFDRFPWREPDDDVVQRWRSGRTGFDLVDAGMRELWATGIMHNRVRLAAASFLVKNLLVDWRVGEQWFWDTLVDADPANNPANWQWVAGSGFDAAPYFRVFNPDLQAKRFDPDRRYIDRWLPTDEERPEPMVDLKASRQRALDAYDRMRHA